MPWPLNPVALPMEERGAKGLFMAIMDTGIKKILPPHTHQEHLVQHLQQHIFKENTTFMIM